jgi:dUTPase
MKLLVKPLVEDFLAPEVKTSGSMGADVYIQKTQCVVGAFPVSKISLGMVAILVDDVGRSRPFILAERSSTCLRKPYSTANKFGLIDSDYRGELIWLVRSYGVSGTAERGERLCQIVPWGTYELITEVEVVDEFPFYLRNTDRGEGGLGSTGSN